MNRAIYPGSFDPLTRGHVDIIHRLHKLYDEIIVLIANSNHKDYLFSAEERAELARQSLRDLEGVEVQVYAGLTVEFARANKIKTVIRGLRVVADFEYEMAMANMNKRLNDDIETMIVFAAPEYHFVSSRMVKEVARHGGSLDGLVSEPVETALLSKMRSSS